MPKRPCLGLGCGKLTEGSYCPTCKRARDQAGNAKRDRQRAAQGKRRGSTRAWRDRRARILARDGRRCTHRYPNGMRCAATSSLHVDHVVPLAKGGTDDDHNLTALCAKHNLSKGGR